MRQCTLSVDAEISVAGLHQRVCLDLIDKEAPGMATQLMVNYTGLDCSVPLALEYYTGNYSAHATSAHLCTGSNRGCARDNCLQVPPQGNIYQLFGWQATQWPGQNGCTEVPGGWENSCGTIDNACVFWRKYFVPSMDLYEVMVPSGVITCRSTFEIHWTSAEELSTVESPAVELTEHEEATFRGFQVSLLGRFDTPTVELGQKRLIQGPKDAYWSNAAPLNQPSRGYPGDIQYSSKNVSVTTTIYDPDIFRHCAVGNNRLACTFGQSGLTHLVETGAEQRLPQERPAYRLWASTNVLVFSMRESPAIRLRLRTPTPVNVRRRAQEVCPETTLLSATGCHSCSLGIQLVLTARSSCHAGLALVTSSSLDLTTRSVPLTTEWTNVNIYGYAAAAAVDDTLQICAGRHCSALPVAFIADEPTIELNTALSTAKAGDVIALPPRSVWSQMTGWLPELSFFWSGTAILGAVAAVGVGVYCLRR
jgi:hypothetical protein